MNRLILIAAATGLALLFCGDPVRAATVTSNGATLAWTAVGDDSLTGRASQYDVRYSTAAITAANFASATRWTAVMVPSTAGARDSVVITGLLPSTTYWFALKVADEVPNWSGISNVLQLTTLPPPDTTPPAAVRDFGVRP